ncbi:MAG: hypothetical protein WAN17_15230 [Candidatus Sulfotelmatobacter sp.]
MAEIPINYSNTTPAAPAGYQNVDWQQDADGNLSANVPETLSFTDILTGVNTDAMMVLGGGAVLTFEESGSPPSYGVINANYLYGIEISSGAPTTGQALIATSPTTAGWQNVSGGGTLATARKTATHYLAGSAAPTAIQDTGSGIGGAQGAVTAVPASQQAAAYQYESTSAGDPAGYQSATNATFCPWWFDGPNLNLFVDAAILQTVTERVWIGMFDVALSTTTIFGSDTLSANQYAAFRYSTVASDTHIQCVCCDGSTQKVVSSGVVADTKSHRFVIIINDSTPNVQFYIDGILVATITSNTPTTSQVKAYMVVGLTSTVTANSYINFTQAMIQQDF